MVRVSFVLLLTVYIDFYRICGGCTVVSHTDMLPLILFELVFRHHFVSVVGPGMNEVHAGASAFKPKVIATKFIPLVHFADQGSA